MKYKEIILFLIDIKYYLLNILNYNLLFLDDESKKQKNYNCRKNFKYKKII